MNETLELAECFCNPIDKNVLTIYNHFRRYAIAIEKLSINNTDTVIDIACGQGYGSYILAQKAFSVIGIDKNNNYLKTARDNFKYNSLRFKDTFPIESNFTVKKIVCIETIEHLRKNKIKGFINKLFAYLEFKGQIFFSFPIGTNKNSTYNKYHLCEPSTDFILDIISKKMYKINVEIESFINSFGHESKYCFMWGSKC